MKVKMMAENTLFGAEVLIPAIFYSITFFGKSEPILYAIVCYILFLLLVNKRFALKESNYYLFAVTIIQAPAVVLWLIYSGAHFDILYYSLPITPLGAAIHGMIMIHHLICLVKKREKADAANPFYER